MRETVGFIGLGAMGLPMAVCLAKAGFDVLTWNRSSGPAIEAARAAGCRTAEQPMQVAAAAPVVFTMLPDLPQVTAVLDGPHGLLAQQPAIDTLVVMGTVSPVAVRELADDLAGRGIAVVDAPVSGGVSGARNATLSIMAGGQPDAVERIRPYLAAMGGTVRHMGGPGAGSLAKACNQLVVAGTLVALAEAVLLAERGGLDPAALLDVLAGGLARSEVLTQKRHHLTTGDFTPSGPARYLLKDLGFVLDSAHDERITLPLSTTLTQLYTAVVAAGHGSMDNSVVLELLRDTTTSGHEAPGHSHARHSPTEVRS